MHDVKLLNVAGYKFTPLSALPGLRETLHKLCHSLQLKGTILLAPEGINLNLCGTEASMNEFKNTLCADLPFADIEFKETYSTFTTFKRLKIKIKKEIITMRQAHLQTQPHRAPTITPETLKQWLDHKKEITLLDVRNQYEIEFGTFVNAIDLKLQHFADFPKVSNSIKKDKPVVMFCTGGIRCEKAALYLLDQGIETYQLEGGILNYFMKVGGEHYQGRCFVFDERITVDSNLKETQPNAK